MQFVVGARNKSRWARLVVMATIVTLSLAVASPSIGLAVKPGPISRNRTVVTYAVSMTGLGLGIGGLAIDNLPMVASGLSLAAISVTVMIKDLQRSLKRRAAGAQHDGAGADDYTNGPPSWIDINVGKVTWAFKNLVKKKGSGYGNIPR